MILESSPEWRPEYQLGTSKVFLRESLEQQLERRRLRVEAEAAIKIQRNVRMAGGTAPSPSIALPTPLPPWLSEGGQRTRQGHC